MLGVHTYADQHCHANDNLFPTDIYDNDGTPLLSWRVALLPYLEEGVLYKKFRLAEPWDSPHNIQLLREMPACFRYPRHDRRSAGMTSYIAVKGDGLFLDPGGKPRVFSDFADGTSRSVAIVEVPPSMEIEWTKPDPPMRDVDGFLEATSNCHGGSRFHAAFADGHVEMLDGSKINRQVFRWLLTINGGEQIPVPVY
jgi:prepilin-type processing-associated H-X9-DG protein